MLEKFPHLKFVKKVTGRPTYGISPRISKISDYNRAHRLEHSENLSARAKKTHNEWVKVFEERKSEGLPKLEKEITPVFFQINPNILAPDFDLESLGIEIISEEEDGYIIGASSDGLRTLQEKIHGFIDAQRSTGKIADLWKIIDGERDIWKPQHILSKQLWSIWNTIDDEEIFEVEVSVAFTKPLKAPPDPTKQGAEKRIEKYEQAVIDRDSLMLQRQDHFEAFINFYGNLTSSIIELDDSFACRVSITGKGLKDLVINYQYVFEVTEIEPLQIQTGEDQTQEIDEIDILPPDENAPEIGIIDSGIMEGHRFLTDAIILANSKSYVTDDPSTADHVKGGGHGTKVAGAILYPQGISNLDFPYKLPCYVRNLRVLNNDNNLSSFYPAELMQKVIKDNTDCKIFNMSINTRSPFRPKHMSTWAAMLDKLSYQDDILFVISAGNISFQTIKNALESGFSYPKYLTSPRCRIANPGHSCFSLTVGSINHCRFNDGTWESLGIENEISAFSRIGTGIWETIKPDVVEFGGGVVISQNGQMLIKNNPETSLELIHSTLHGGKAVGKDTVGTSFAAPKVTHIAAILKQLYPAENSSLLRAFIAQGARLPSPFFTTPTKESLQQYGYGLPSLERVTRNSDNRVTFYNSSTIAAEEGHLYSVAIPEELRNPGNEYDILIEVTLAYSANIRRTRQKLRSYLSTWVDWTNAYLDEELDEFSFRVLAHEGDNERNETDSNREIINWAIRERNNWGEVRDVNRNNNTLQKDWAILKSHQLPKEFVFAVRGHNGWDKKKLPVPYSIVVSIEVLGTELPIYESIRIENQVEIEI